MKLPPKLLPIKLFDTVIFNQRVFEEPFAPYYDAYKDQVFRVIGIHPGAHIELECTSDKNVVVQGHVHYEDLIVSNLKI